MKIRLLLFVVCSGLVVADDSSEHKKCPAKKKTHQTQTSLSLFQREAEFPADAKAGECYVRVRRPAEYRSEDVKVVLKEASVRYEVVPAVFKDVDKKVLVRPEVKRFEVVPAKFEKKVTKVVKVPEHKTLTAVAADFSAVKERVETRPCRILWKQGDDPLADVKGVVGKVWCLIRDDATFSEYTRQNLTRKARVKEHVVKSEMQEVSTMQLVTPALVKEIVEKAEYKTVRVREMVSPAITKKIVIPAQHKTIRKQVLVRAEEVVWQRVLCDTNLTQDLIRKIQSKLHAKKYDCGRSKGKLTKQTLDAVKKYQKDHKLGVGGLTYEFLEHLKVE